MPARAREVSALAASIFSEGPVLMRALLRWRPYICPFETLLPLVPAGARVLDVGCGGGLFLGLLARIGRLGHGTGFDVSPPAIEVARRVAARMDEGVLTFLHRGVEDAWPEGPFDVVSMIDVMHHVPPAAQRETFDHAAGRVAAGGLLLYKDMCRRPRWRALANRAHDLVLARQWIRYAPIEQVESWAEAHGLVLDTAARIDRWWYGHELRLFRRPAAAPRA
jgi:2-polyprenyl-3-methyl-5-hydroxy-6-metoxy-1,4-benzoquinol methylase